MKLVRLPTISAKIPTPLPIISNVFAIAPNDFSRSTNLLNNAPPAIKSKKLPIEEKILFAGAGAPIVGKILRLDFFSNFSSLFFIFSLSLSFLPSTKEKRLLSYFFKKNFLIPSNLSMKDAFGPILSILVDFPRFSGFNSRKTELLIVVLLIPILALGRSVVAIMLHPQYLRLLK